MGVRGRPKAPLILSDEDRETLERWARRPNSAQALALRCRIVLACAEGATNTEVAARVGVNQATVCKWRGRFVARRLDGLADEPRPGAARTITDDDVERVIVIPEVPMGEAPTHGQGKMGWCARNDAGRSVVPLSPS
ncbi:MAG: helix-turn-helix domain-containing protein [Actinomycetota bacterium]